MQPQQRVAKSDEAFVSVGLPWTPFTVHGPTGDEVWSVDVAAGRQFTG